MATTYTYSAIPYRIHEDAPPSPTLTNPDMILPQNPHHSSPTPIASSPTLHSDLDLTPVSRYRSQSSESRSSEQRNAEVGVAKAVVMPLRVKPPPPTTIPLLYHNYEHGAPLSDIGEEDSTPKSRKTVRSRSPSPVRNRSPTRTMAFGPPLRHKNRLSISSDVSTGSDPGSWEDFDTSKMMNARLAADVARVDEEMSEADGLESKRNSTVAVPEDETNVWNQKAERILADAKKRLTLMEDNLSKARNSVLISPRTSPVIGDLHQPVGGLYRSISQGGDRRLGPGYVRKSKSLFPVLRNASVGHFRGLSDNSASVDPASQAAQARSASALEFNRRMDAMLPTHSSNGQTGQSPGSNRSYNSPLRALQEEGAGVSPSTNNTSPHTPGSATATRGLGITNSSPTTIVPKRSSASPTDLVRSNSQASTRSTQELRSQMSDLKTRIEGLRQQAQSDSMRRQSLQNLRTPSPFGHAPEQWYTSAPEYQDGNTPINNNAGLGWSPSKAFNDSPRSPTSPQDSAFGDGRISQGITPVTVRTDVNTPTLARNTVSKPALRLSGGNASAFAQGSHYEDAAEGFGEEDDGTGGPSEEEQVYLNEALEESLQNGEPDIPIMLDDDYLQDQASRAERHEDRVDAFDYENMFLHSALGNYSQNHPQEEEEDSDTDSEDSVETRRAIPRSPTDARRAEEDDEEECHSESMSDEHSRSLPDSTEAEADEPPTPRASTATMAPLKPPRAAWMKAARSNSMDSVSTSATFETATEGLDDEEEETPDEILNWGNHVPGGFVSPPTTSQWSTTPRLGPVAGVNGNSRPVSRGKEKHLLTNGHTTSPRQRQSPRSIPLPQSPPQLLPSPSVASPVRSAPAPQQTTHQPANTEILMGSLITLADPNFQMPGEGNSFADVDKQLVIALLRAVGAVCGNTLAAERGSKGESERMSWRRRLETARAILERGSME